jgi:hypothetical protein
MLATKKQMLAVLLVVLVTRVLAVDRQYFIQAEPVCFHSNALVNRELSQVLWNYVPANADCVMDMPLDTGDSTYSRFSMRAVHVFH